MDLLRILLGVYTAAWNQIFDFSDALQNALSKQYDILRILCRLGIDAPQLAYFSLKHDSAKAAESAADIRISIEMLLARDDVSAKSARHLEKMVENLKKTDSNLVKELTKKLAAYYEKQSEQSASPPTTKN